MCKRKYNHKVGDTYVECGRYRCDNTPWYTFRHIISVEQKGSNEILTILVIATSVGNRSLFTNTISSLKRESFNKHVRRSMRFSQFIGQYRLEFLTTIGYSIQEIIRRARERHKKYHNRYKVKIAPNLINIGEEQQIS